MNVFQVQNIKPEGITHCPVCNGTDFFTWARSYDRLHRVTLQVFQFRSCQACSALFLADRPNKSQIDIFYPQDYAPYSDHSTGMVDKASLFLNIMRKACALPGMVFQKIFNRNSELTLANFYSSADGLLLDYGCGSAKFLNKARKMGWDTLGVDFSGSVIQHVVDSGHKGIHSSDNLDEAIKDESVNLFRLNHVFEHLYNPSDMLSFMHDKIKSGGKILIAMPNPEGLSAWIFRKYWFSLDCPRHIILYPPALIRNLAQKTGFKNITILDEYINKDFSRSVGYWLCQKGYMRPQRATELHSSAIWDLFSTVALVVGFILQKPDRYYLIATKL